MTGAEIALVAAIVLAVVMAGGLVVMVVALLRSRAAGDLGAERAAEEASRLRSALSDELGRNRSELGDAVSKLREEVNKRLAESTQTTGERLDGSAKRVDSRLEAVAKRIADVGKSLAAMDESHKQIRELARDIAGLQKILQPPKLRGGLGELLMENALREVLPETQFALQHTYADGKRVDAVIRLGERAVPVDSKVPLDAFRRMMEADGAERTKLRRDFVRDVKLRIDETASYIRPGEGTFDFALMYVPAENVYYEAVLKSPETAESITSYARKRKVVIVSPNSFFAYLQAIAVGLKGLKVEERAEEVILELGRLGREFAVFAEEFRLVGRHVSNAAGKFQEAENRLAKFAARLEALESLEGDPPGEDS